MCLKSVNTQTMRWSITARLTLLFTLAAMFIQALVSIYLYLSLEQTYQKTNHQYLSREIQLLNNVTQDKPLNLTRLKDEQLEGLNLPNGKYYSRVLDEHNRLLSQTPGASLISSNTKLPVNALEPYETLVHLNDDRSFYVLINTVHSPTSLTFQFFLDVSNQQSHLSEYKRTLMLAFILGLLLSGFAAFAITRHGLKPLAVMANRMGNITASQLMQQLDPGDHPAELTELIQSFNSMLNRLSQSFEQLQQFSADIAHELRTPVNNLIGESEVLLGKIRTSDEYQQLIVSNLDEYHRLTQIIEALLFLARVDNTEIKLKKQELDAASEVKAVFSYFEALAEIKKIELVCEGDGVVLADRQLLRRVLSNLIHNSLQYTQEEGVVIVHILNEVPDETKIIVKDSGKGIDHKHLPKIFDRFYRASASRSEEGSGLGLAIVKSIMAVHGGSVSIESAVGVGTTVSLIFKLN